MYRARGDRFLGHGFHSTALRNQSGESSDAVRIGPQRRANLNSTNAEGFVCKNRNAVYAGGRAGQHFKCKFVVTASFIIGPKPEKKANDGHRSIVVYLLDANRPRRPQTIAYIVSGFANYLGIGY